MIISSVSQGLLWGILGLGIYLTFRILNFPDMTTEGSFPLGGGCSSNPAQSRFKSYPSYSGCYAGGCFGRSSDRPVIHKRKDTYASCRHISHDLLPFHYAYGYGKGQFGLA